MFRSGLIAGLGGSLGKLLTSSLTSKILTPRDSHIRAISLAKAIFTSRYAFSTVLATSAVRLPIGTTGAFKMFRYRLTACWVHSPVNPPTIHG